MPRLSAALLALTLAAHAGCGGLTKNQSRGMLYGGAAAVFMGGVIAIDGLSCDETANGEAQCDEDKADLYGGVAVVSVGLVLGILGYVLRPEAKEWSSGTKTAAKE